MTCRVATPPPSLCSQWREYGVRSDIAAEVFCSPVHTHVSVGRAIKVPGVERIMGNAQVQVTGAMPGFHDSCTPAQHFRRWLHSSFRMGAFAHRALSSPEGQGVARRLQSHKAVLYDKRLGLACVERFQRRCGRRRPLNSLSF